MLVGGFDIKETGLYVGASDKTRIKRIWRKQGDSSYSGGMKVALNRRESPEHLFFIQELDFSDDLFSEPLAHQWFRLGAWTYTARRDERGVEDIISRQSLEIGRAHV